jgi:outer membrane protein assembly factor BamA
VSDAMRAELSQPIIGNPVASSLDRTTTPVLERDMFGNEIFYRTMSQEHYEKLQKTGKIQKTAETSIAPLEEYSSKYQGVLVRIVAEPGTAEKLREIAVSANDATSQRFNDLEDTFKGWGKQQAQFKVNWQARRKPNKYGKWCCEYKPWEGCCA